MDEELENATKAIADITEALEPYYPEGHEAILEAVETLLVMRYRKAERNKPAPAEA